MDDMISKAYNSCPGFLQTLGINIFELEEKRIRCSKKFGTYLKLLIGSEKWTQADLIDYQNKHLRQIVEFAYRNVPFYHNLYKKHGIDIEEIKTIEDLKHLPTINKDDLINNWTSFQSLNETKIVTRHTSGTTGKPLDLRISYDLAVLDKANAFRRDLWAGYDGEWIARFVGDSPVKDCRDKVLFRKSYAIKRAIFPSYCLHSRKLPDIIENLKKLDIKFIQCYPSTGYVIAKFLELHDEFLPLKGVLYSSEPILDHQRAVMEERFKTKLWGFYGQGELALSAIECGDQEYHLAMIDGILEIAKNGEPASRGEKGLTVATSLHNFAMPLIRYELNDYTGYKEDSCSCGRSLPLIHAIETRSDDFVVTPSGRIISPQLMDLPLKYVKNILETQFVQRTIDSIVVRIVRQNSYNDSDELTVLNSYKQLFGDEMQIRIDYVDKIYQTSSYKKRIVINELGKEYIERFLGDNL